MPNEYSSLWRNFMDDVGRPGILWQVGVLLLCLAIAKLAERRVAAHDVRDSKAWQIGHAGLIRVVFPMVALMFVVLSWLVLRHFLSANLLALTVPLLASLVIIRAVFYVLRYSFAGSSWVATFERVFALLVFIVVAMHITGLLPELIDALESVTFRIGKDKLSLWRVLRGATMLLTTVLLALWLANALERQLSRADGVDEHMRAVLGRLFKTFFVLAAILIGLPLLGIDITTLSVFGGALGVGIGFGLQKTVANYFSGFVLLLDRSIRIGNLITVGTDRGVVTQITTRYTVVKSLIGVEALVPNELMIASVVRNESFSDKVVRLAMQVQVGYDSNLDRACAIMRAAAEGQPRVLKSPPPDVWLKEFGDDGIKIELGIWINDPQEGTGSLRSDIFFAIWHEFKQAGITIPYPQRDVHLVANPQSSIGLHGVNNG